MKRRHTSRKVLYALICLLLIGFAINSILKRSFSYGYDPGRSYTYMFDANHSTMLTLSLNNGILDLSALTESCQTVFLELDIRSNFQGWFTQPEISMTSENVHSVQQFECRSRGKRYLNISPFVQKNAIRIQLKGKGCKLPKKVRLIGFKNQEPVKGRILILSPHPDDAEIAAYGLYASNPNNTWIATITAGEAGRMRYDELFADSASQYAAKGKLRVWNSMTVPLLGGVASDRIYNLGYFDGRLKDMYSDTTKRIRSKYLTTNSIQTFRSPNCITLPYSKQPRTSWRSLVNDLKSLLKLVNPTLIVTPHPGLDFHLDHRFTTLALAQALRELHVEKAQLWMYTTHFDVHKRYPEGKIGSAVSLPPFFGEQQAYFEAVASITLSDKLQSNKVLALDAMNDLRPDTQYRDIAASWEQLWSNIVRKLYLNETDYFRRSVRNNELFFVVDSKTLLEPSNLNVFMPVYNVIDFGAIGDGKSDNALALQRTIDECANNGGGTVLVPKGIFLTGPFKLKSNVHFRVTAGATVLANPDEQVYTESAFKSNYGEGSLWMSGKDAINVTISGPGIIDGNGIAFMGPEESAAYVLKPFKTFDRRPHLFTPIHFTNLQIRDVTFRNSAYWCLHLVGCNQVDIRRVTLLNNRKIRNSDGIDPDHSKNVTIHDCYIESGDDCICPKTRREYEEYGPTENVTVSNCTMKSTSCSIKLGSENMDAIRNVRFSNCIIKNSNRAIGIQHRDEGLVENVLFENIVVESSLYDDVWWGKAEPIYITAYKRKPGNAKDANWRFAKGQLVGKVGNVRNITFRNIIATSENGIYVGGEPGKIDGILFDHVRVTINKTSKYKGGVYDLRPSDTIGMLEAGTSGFYMNGASNVQLLNCSVQWGANKPNYYKHALYASQINGLMLSGFNGRSANPPLCPDKLIEACTNVRQK